MLITVYNSVGWPLRTISKNDTILDQHLVGKGVGGDEDGRVRAHLESDDWAILGVQVSEDWFKLQGRYKEPLQVPNDRNRGGSWWELSFWKEEIIERFEESSNTEGDDDEQPYLHFSYQIQSNL